jgi:uncharacterized membrane protein YdjX (TVP38/TMEM64 family)
MNRLKTLWPLVLVALIAIAVLVGRQAVAYLPSFVAWVESLGPLGPIAFIAGYAIAVMILVPASILTLLGGALFGIVRGTAFVLVGATIGAVAAFLVSRHVARNALRRRFAEDARFHEIDRAVAREGRKIVFLLRLSPAIPFSMMNYALGLTSIRLVDFATASLAMLPVTIMWVYYGRLIGDVAKLLSGQAIAHGLGYWIFLVVGLIATILVTVIITRIARSALADSTTKGEA